MIVEVSPDSLHYEQVIKLGNANSATLGFLPYEAIRQAAAEGRVLASVKNDEVKGYALYGVRVKTGNISLTHLCIDRSQRGQGIARELVDDIIKRNPQRAGIRLSCRKDYAADAMWPKLEFQRLGERPGRSRAGHPLVAWWRPIAAQTLFGEPEQEETRLVAAIDTNILLDICEKRNHPASLALTADWVTEAAELVVTSQSHSELSEPRSDSEEFESKLGEFRDLEPSETAWQTELQPLQDDPTIARVGEKDLRVVAQAAAGSAAYLITRDEHLLQQSERVEQMTGLKVVGPDDFLLRLQGLGGEHGHQTRKITASGISVIPVSEMPSKAELSDYCHKHISERSSDLRQRLGIVARLSGQIVKMISDSGKPLALGAVYRDGTQAIITALRCTAEARADMAVRHMVHKIRSIVADDGPATIVVDDLTSLSVDRALHDEGFKLQGAMWSADLQTGIFRPNDPLPDGLAEIGWNGLDAHLIRDYERSAWPAKVFSGSIPSYMVPIKSEYARVILGYSEPQERLFELNRKAAASRTNVYYMSPRSLETPARIIWWISGGGSLGGVRAISWLDEVETGPPQRLHRKYRDHGVLDKQQVIGIAKPSPNDGPKATAMLFSQIEIFPEPVPIARSRELYDKMNQPGYFRTTQKIDEDTVYRFYTEGMKVNED